MKRFLLPLIALICLQSNAQDTWELETTTLTEYDLVTGVQIPWEIMWGPDDFIWATERRGRVLRINPETGNFTTVLNIQSTIAGGGSGEPGMLGMVAHPDFENNPYIYIAYNYGSWPNYKQRLARWEWNGTALVSEEYIMDNMPAGGIHNGARLLVLEDNTLLMTTGDVGNGNTAQNMNSLSGKTLRMNLDGSIPSDNPDPNSYVYSFGHRNSQGLCLGPNGLIYASEHGQNAEDELNILEMNGNYGWPQVEGMCNLSSEQDYCMDNDVVSPIDSWSPCIAVNGIEYYNHPAIPEWQNSILMAVLGGLGAQYERLSVLHMNDDGTQVESEDQFFSEFNQRVRDICVNPYTGAVYVALNGSSYPGSGPNIIKEFVNEDFDVVDNVPTIQDQNVKLFPNPASDVMNIELEDTFLGTAFEIISFNGQTVKKGMVDSQKMTLDVSEYAAGKYYFVSSTHLGTVTKTFIVK